MNLPFSDPIFKATSWCKDFWITPETAEQWADRISAWIKKRVTQSGFDGVVIGMSGGLDSAVVGALCARGDVPVYAVMMPYGDSMRWSGSFERAMEMVNKFGWEHEVIDIKPIYQAFEASRDGVFQRRATDKNRELAFMNACARIRTDMLRNVAQLLGNWLVIGTDTLTEIMLGYFTKDGNGCDLRPTGMLLKKEMRMLAYVIGVVLSIIQAVPSAELRKGQTDEGELGFLLDCADEYIRYGTCRDKAIDNKIADVIRRTQHKRDAVPMFMGMAA